MKKKTAFAFALITPPRTSTSTSPHLLSKDKRRHLFAKQRVNKKRNPLHVLKMKVVNIAKLSLLIAIIAGSSTSLVAAFSFNPNPPPFPGSPTPPSNNVPSQEPPQMDPAGSGRYDDTRPAPGMSGVARPPPLSRENAGSSGGGRTASSINQPLVRSARGTGNDPVVGGSDGTWWEAAGVAAYATKGQ